MKISPLVNQPNIANWEAGVKDGNYSLHSPGWCGGFELAVIAGAQMPFFISVDNGPIQCRSCGRRIGKNLRRLLLNHCKEALFTGVIDTQVERVVLTYYKVNRKDLPEGGLGGWHSLTKLLEGLT